MRSREASIGSGGEESRELKDLTKQPRGRDRVAAVAIWTILGLGAGFLATSPLKAIAPDLYTGGVLISAAAGLVVGIYSATRMGTRVEK